MIDSLVKTSSLSSASIGCIVVGVVLACSAIIFGAFMFYRRGKRKNSNAGVGEGTLKYPVGKDGIDLVPTKSSSLRYPDIEEQDFGANLSSDEKETPHSLFEPKLSPAIISISRS